MKRKIQWLISHYGCHCVAMTVDNITEARELFLLIIFLELVLDSSIILKSPTR